MAGSASGLRSRRSTATSRSRLGHHDDVGVGGVDHRLVEARGHGRHHARRRRAPVPTRCVASESRPPAGPGSAPARRARRPVRAPRRPRPNRGRRRRAPRARRGRTSPARPWPTRASSSGRPPRSIAARATAIGAPAVEQIGGRLGQRLLVVGELEVHGAASVADARVTPRRRSSTMPPVDLTPTAEQEQLRTECRSWLREHLPWEYGTGLPPRFASLDDEVAFGREWQHQLADGRWVGVTWPERVRRPRRRRARPLRRAGGAGPGPGARARRPHRRQPGRPDAAGPRDRRAAARAGCPTSCAADILFCQLFSEPDAGSDLASLATRAERTSRDGADGWSLTGQKVWTSYAQFADWGLCLARTDPTVRKQAGITAFVVDMRAPGVDVRPLRQITGESDFNEVFLDDVFVPDDCVVGAVNDGWRVSSLDPHPRAGHQPPPARDPLPSTSRSCCGWPPSGAASTTTASRNGCPRPTSR